MKDVTSPSDIPTTEHWALIEGSSVYIEGDERSLSAPGHGYPAHTVSYISYRAFPSLESVTQEIQRREVAKYSSSKPYRVLHVKPMTVQTEIKIAVA